MSTITKERAQQIFLGNGPEPTASEERELARIALASLEAEPVALRDERSGSGGISKKPGFNDLQHGTPLYTAPPAPVSVPDGYRLQPISEYDAMCAAMLQGADRPQNEPQNIPENIPATQFKPVADLYGLTSPTGGETSFTFDAVEARDFIDGGWSCQEYVELGRFQEAMLQNGSSPAQSDCCPEQNYIAPAQDGDSPVIPDGWVACSERMPEQYDYEIWTYSPTKGVNHSLGYDGHARTFSDVDYYSTIDDVTHWMPITRPAAPRQETK
ncbi:DUF551 domain-containing protein [Enterobacter hormaechei]|uniref:DUF551 domain-containing protein n=1 Tax=Enterobacter hormaechei TaxID=158836 RepID=UPI000799DC8C|nr:DUF551 domain-containing protein [Enterobacter hormaechei]CZU55430.1 Protein of uncharacterised function (DUF551) [Enterobacter hormaechei]